MLRSWTPPAKTIAFLRWLLEPCPWWCKGPYGPHGTCCNACVRVHAKHPKPRTCLCNDCKLARAEPSYLT